MTPSLLPRPGSTRHAVLTGIAACVDLFAAVTRAEAAAARRHLPGREELKRWVAVTELAMKATIAWIVTACLAAVLLINSGSVEIAAGFAAAGPVASVAANIALTAARRRQRPAADVRDAPGTR